MTVLRVKMLESVTEREDARPSKVEGGEKRVLSGYARGKAEE